MFIDVTISDKELSWTYRDTAPTRSDAAEAVEATTGLFSNMDFFAPFDDFGTKSGKTISDIIELFAS